MASTPMEGKWVQVLSKYLSSFFTFVLVLETNLVSSYYNIASKSFKTPFQLDVNSPIQQSYNILVFI